jgi:DNA modification methylase
MSVRVEHLAEGVSLYLGDCREVLPTLGNTLIVTDPPYNIGFKYEGHDDAMAAGAYASFFLPMQGNRCAILHYPEDLIRLVVPVLGPPDKCLAWPYASNLPRQFRLIGLWGLDPAYSNAPQPVKNPDVSKVKTLFARSYDWISDCNQVKGNSLEKTGHPCQAPEKLFDWIIKLVSRTGERIVDPFMGSGTTGAAAVKCGREFTGIEVEPRYFDIARKRIQAALDAPDMFIEPPAKIKQEALL